MKDKNTLQTVKKEIVQATRLAMIRQSIKNNYRALERLSKT